MIIRRHSTVFSDIILHIIEEISDGFLIINDRGEIVFFNEVLLKLVDWRSMDILTHEKKFLEFLNADLSKDGDWNVKIASRAGKINSFSVHSFRVHTDEGYYSLMRLKPDYAEDVNLSRNYRKDYHELFNNLDDGIITVDIKGHILSVNPAFLRLIGYDEKKLPENIGNLYVYKDEFEDKLMRVLKTGAVSNLETHLYTRDNTIRRTLDSSWIVRDKVGEVIGYTSQFKDITYLKNIESRLKISERNFTFLFDTILSSIVIVDPEGCIVNFNSAAEKMYGYSWEELVGKKYDDVFRYSKDFPSFAKVLNLIDKNEGKYIEPEVKRTTKDGETIFTYAAYTSIRDSGNEIIAFSISEKDLTERVRLETKLKESIEQIKETQSATILGFSKLTEYRDKTTGKHLERIREYTRLMALSLKELPEYKEYITPDYLEDLALSSTLHDVGKVGIEDSILLKTGKLTPDEFDRIKSHALLGGEALGNVDEQLSQKSFLTMGKQIAYFHHEHWDGTGYPNGLKGKEIPLSARIVAIADVYDALTSDRPYKKAFSHEDAVEIIQKERGKHFDPDIVDAFIQNHEAFKRIKLFVELEEHPENITNILEERKREIVQS